MEVLPLWYSRMPLLYRIWPAVFRTAVGRRRKPLVALKVRLSVPEPSPTEMSLAETVPVTLALPVTLMWVEISTSSVSVPMEAFPARLSVVPALKVRVPLV